MNPNTPKQTASSGPPQQPPHTEDTHKQLKPAIPLAAPKPVAAGQGTTAQSGQSDVKPAPPNKDLRTGPSSAKAAAAVPHAALEPVPSAKKPTSGQTQTTVSNVKPAALGASTTTTTTENLATAGPSTSSNSSTTASAKAGASAADSSTRFHPTDSGAMGTMFQRATSLSNAVPGQAGMSEAMLDDLRGGGGGVAEDSLHQHETFTKARPSVQQLRYPTPYPTTLMSPLESEQTPEVGIRDVDAIEVFKRRRTSVSSDVSTTSMAQQVADRQAKKSLKPKSDFIDEEHQLSKGERPLKSVLKSDSGVKRRKGVKFCDVEGVELATVRHYFDQEEAPEVPLYATAYLNLEEMYDTVQDERNDQQVLRPSFSQPGAAPDFMGRVHLNKVALEFCLVSDTEKNVTGTVRVANIAFNKSVTIRYTTNNWKHTDEIKANYVYYSHDGATDRFSFIIQLPTSFGPGQLLQFAVRYDAGTEIFWDNNFGQNYKVECFTREMLQTAANSNYLSSIHPTFTWLQYL